MAEEKVSQGLVEAAYEVNPEAKVTQAQAEVAAHSLDRYERLFQVGVEVGHKVSRRLGVSHASTEVAYRLTTRELKASWLLLEVGFVSTGFRVYDCTFGDDSTPGLWAQGTTWNDTAEAGFFVSDSAYASGGRQ